LRKILEEEKLELERMGASLAEDRNQIKAEIQKFEEEKAKVYEESQKIVEMKR
jgi:hypothetical protein